MLDVGGFIIPDYAYRLYFVFATQTVFAISSSHDAFLVKFLSLAPVYHFA